MAATLVDGLEFSSGGVVTLGGKVLLIRMRALSGDLIWTFPKGHLEGAESARAAALREVAEESGYACEILAPLALVRYSFQRGPKLVRKRVRWYWMKPLKRMGSPDVQEIFGLRWLDFDRAKQLLRYPSDLRLLDKVRCLARARHVPGTG